MIPSLFLCDPNSHSISISNLDQEFRFDTLIICLRQKRKKEFSTIEKRKQKTLLRTGETWFKVAKEIVAVPFEAVVRAAADANDLI